MTYAIVALQLSSSAQELLPRYLEDCFKCEVISMPQREFATLRSCEAAAAIRGPHGCVDGASVLQMHFPMVRLAAHRLLSSHHAISSNAPCRHP